MNKYNTAANLLFPGTPDAQRYDSLYSQYNNINDDPLSHRREISIAKTCQILIPRLSCADTAFAFHGHVFVFIVLPVLISHKYLNGFVIEIFWLNLGRYRDETYQMFVISRRICRLISSPTNVFIMISRRDEGKKCLNYLQTSHCLVIFFRSTVRQTNSCVGFFSIFEGEELEAAYKDSIAQLRRYTTMGIHLQLHISVVCFYS